MSTKASTAALRRTSQRLFLGRRRALRHPAAEVEANCAPGTWPAKMEVITSE